VTSTIRRRHSPIGYTVRMHTGERWTLWMPLHAPDYVANGGQQPDSLCRSVKEEIAAFRADLHREIRALERKFAGLLVIQTAVIIAAVKLIP
jgi:hypothetical protein